MNAPSLDLLLLELQDVIRSMPSPLDFSANPDKCIPWLGRASAAMGLWDAIRSIAHFEPVVKEYATLHANRDRVNFTPFRQSLLVLLHQAESGVRLRTTGPLSIGVDSGRVFEYFDELRKVIESARSDLLFVDPYLDAEFASKYLPQVPGGTAVRLLAREKVASLKPAVVAWVAQSSASVALRSAPGFHDRYVFVDGQACYQSGASFKDGAKKAPTVLTQITDAFNAVRSTYEQLWNQATPV
jgi:hypothetical protein